MPLVRMLTSIAGSRVSWDLGEEVEMSPEEAAVYADGVRGELVRGPAVETPEGRSARMETPEGRRQVRRATHQ